MNPSEFNIQSEKLIEVQCEDRWQVYRRLQELGIPCQCCYHQPLRVQIDTVVIAVQVWSVVKQIIMPRQVLVKGLEDCWRIRCSSENRSSESSYE